MRKKGRIYRDLYRKDLAPIEGLLDFYNQAKSPGLILAVVTLDISAKATLTLNGLDIKAHFNAVIDSTMVIKAK